jgi:archaetidylinositol phosphate synthase
MRIDPPWDQRLARASLRPLIWASITPNQITTLSLAIGLLAAFLYTRGGWAAHLGAACLVLSLWLDHADGELARSTGRTSAFGHYYDLAADCCVLVAVFVGIGIGEGMLGFGVAAGLGTTAIIVLRMALERRGGKAAVRQPNLLGFELEDIMYLLAPITWLGLLQPFLLLAGIGAPLFALFVLWECRRLLPGKAAV